MTIEIYAQKTKKEPTKLALVWEFDKIVLAVVDDAGNTVCGGFIAFIGEEGLTLCAGFDGKHFGIAVQDNELPCYVEVNKE